MLTRSNSLSSTGRKRASTSVGEQKRASTSVGEQAKTTTSEPRSGTVRLGDLPVIPSEDHGSPSQSLRASADDEQKAPPASPPEAFIEDEDEEDGDEEEAPGMELSVETINGVPVSGSHSEKHTMIFD